MGTSKKKKRNFKQLFKRDNAKRGLAWLMCAGLIVGVGWAGARCLPEQGDESRQLTADEAGRLSQVRTTLAQADPVAVKLTLPEDAGGGGFDGHVDWSAPLVHGATTAAGTSKPDGLVQAVPGLIAAREGEADPNPKEIPEDGWSVRRMQPEVDEKADPAQTAVDIVLSALLSLPSEQKADPAGLREHGAWLREASVDGAAVDVVQAPLLLDTAQLPPKAGQGAKTSDPAEAAAEASVPEAVFWVDRDGLLRRVQFDPAGSGLATVDFLWERDDAAAPQPVDVLGGGDNEPRDVDDKEVEVLSELRHRNSFTGAEVDVVLPVADNEVIRAKGYVDWRRPMVYLSVDAPGKDNDGLLFVLPGGAATVTKEVDGMPPDSPPQEGWKAQPWSDRVDDGEASDFDMLLFKLLVLSSAAPDDQEVVADTASWLREDSVGGTETAVYEFPIAGDPETEEPGQAPFRYWLGAEDDVLYRVEMNTQNLGMAHADLKPQEEPPAVEIPYGVMAELSAG